MIKEYYIDDVKFIVDTSNGNLVKVIPGPNKTKIDKFPEGITTIGNEAFSYCSGLESIELPEGIKTIGNNSFSQCSSLRSIKIPKGIETIGEKAFYGCRNLQSIELPEGIETIGIRLFFRCGSLQSIELPEGLKSIGKEAFSCCNNLKLINLPDSVTSIGYNAILDNTKVNYRGFEFNGNELIDDKRFELLDYPLRDIENISMLGLFYNEINLKLFENVDSKLLKNHVMEIFRKEKASDIIYDKFKYSLKQNLVDKDVLKKIYFVFDFDFDNNNEDENKKLFEKLLHDNMKNIDIDLLTTLVSEDELELRDRLVFVSTMKYLDKNTDLTDLDVVTTMLKRNQFSNLIEVDKKLYYKHYDFNNKLISENDSKEYFQGINYYLTKELLSIDPKLIKLFSNNYASKTINFLSSLNTINKWTSNLDYKDRATILKNEVVGRIVYSLLRISAEDTNEYKDYVDGKINIKDFNKYINSNKFRVNYDLGNVDLDKFWEYLCRSDFNEIASDYSNINEIDKIYFNKLMKDNPYFFDVFRGEKNIDDQLYKIAYMDGYLFKGNEVSHINELSRDNDIDVIAQAIINDIGISKIPEESEQAYLDNVNLLIGSYFKKEIKDENELFAIFRSVDVYLRKNFIKEYMDEVNPTALELSKDIFDIDNPNYDDNDRLCYCLYNLNRLAHSISKLNMRVVQIEAKKYKSDGDLEKTKLDKGIDGYNVLQKYGLPISTINSSIINSIVLTSLVNKQVLYRKVNDILKELNNMEDPDYKFNDIKNKLKNYISLVNPSDTINIESKTVEELKLYIECLNIDKEKQNNLLDELKDVKKAKNKIASYKRKLIKYITDDFSSVDGLNIFSEDDINQVNTYSQLKTILEKFNNDNDSIIEDNIKNIRININPFIQSDVERIHDINNVSNDEVSKIANHIYSVKQLDEKTREKIRIDAAEQSLFYKAKGLVALEYLKTLNNYVKEKIKEKDLLLDKDASNKKFFQENGYLIEFQQNSTGELLVCYNPKFNEPFSVHLQDMSMVDRNMFDNMKYSSITYSQEDRGLTKARKFVCQKGEELPKYTTGGFINTDKISLDMKNSIKKSIRITNFLNYDAFVIKDRVIDFINSNPTSEEINKFIGELDSYIPITESDTVKFMGEDISIKDKYHNIIGYNKLVNLNKTKELFDNNNDIEILDEEIKKDYI